MSEDGTQTNYRHWFTSRLPYGRLSLPVRFQVIQGIASIPMYFSYHCNPISASVKARGETGILISSHGVQTPGQEDLTWYTVTPLPPVSTLRGHHLMFHILLACAASWIQRNLVQCCFCTPGLRCLRIEIAFKHVINVAHVLIIRVKDFFLVGCLLLLRAENLIPLSVRWLNTPIREPQLFGLRGWRTRCEGHETKERLGRLLWAPPPQLKHMKDPFFPFQHSLFHIPPSSLNFIFSPLDFLLFFFCLLPPPPLLWLFNHKRLAASGIKPLRDVWAWRKMDG